LPSGIHYGLGLHIQDVQGYTIEQVLLANKLILWIAEFLYAFSLFFAKTSILCFYWRVFGVSRTMKLAIKIMLGCALVWIIVRVFLGIFHCMPAQAYWEPTAGGYCAIEDTKFFFGSILVHVTMDMAIILLPVIPIKRLALPLRQRIGIAVVFMFGFFICFAGIMIVYESTRFDTTSIDLTWNIEPIVTWATVELNMVVVSTSLPMIRPALLWITGRKPAVDTTRHSDPNPHNINYGQGQNRQSGVPSPMSDVFHIRRAATAASEYKMFSRSTTSSNKKSPTQNMDGDKMGMASTGGILTGIGTRGSSGKSGHGSESLSRSATPLEDGDSALKLARTVSNDGDTFVPNALDGTDFRTVINSDASNTTAGGSGAGGVGGVAAAVRARLGRVGHGPGYEAAVPSGIVVQSETSVRFGGRRRGSVM